MVGGKKRLRVAVLSQNDSFVVPNNIAMLHQSSVVSIVVVMEITGAASVRDKAGLFFRGFGFWQFMQLGLKELSNKVLNYCDLATFYKLNMRRSLKSVAANVDAQYVRTTDPNSPSALQFLQSNEIDVIVSFSAPVVFKSKLLSLASYGCLNLHCSLLPEYAGLLPSFWTLYHRESELGVTVHRMGSRIDDGEILAQTRLSAPENNSMFSAIKSTKIAGGQLMLEVVERIASGERLNGYRSTPRKYFPWPRIDEIKEFKRMGGRLI